MKKYYPLLAELFLRKKIWRNPLIVTGTFIFISLSTFFHGLISYGFDVFLQISICFTGLIFFTLAEYLIHRFLLHRGKDEKIEAWKSKSHVHHHKYPNDEGRLDLALPIALLIAVLFYLFTWFFMGGFGLFFTAGFLIGYAIYSYIHYLIHVKSPPNNIFRYLWKYHAIHHHLDHSTAFGVTSPFWDIVFRTMPDAAKYGRRRSSE